MKRVLILLALAVAVMAPASHTWSKPPVVVASHTWSVVQP